MKQILQSLKTGNTTLEDLPSPMPYKGSILVQTTHSLVSLGTEKMLVEFGKANLIKKARQQPEKVKLVLDKIKTEGLIPTLETVFRRLEQPLPLGYCNVGTIIDCGDNISEFSIGDRVASNGPHAEVVCVPKNLAIKVPKGVSNEEATFTVIGSIGLQGIRLLKPQLGETIVVYGLGLIGLICCQLLKQNGCNVIGIDLDPNKCNLANKWNIPTINPNINHPVNSVMDYTDAVGADGVLITASTQSKDVIANAAKMSRKKGRIVLVGVAGLDIDRRDFYEKELTFQVSCSYGPGRYDEDYEQKGIDYPIAYVRWTEKRNFQTILDSIKTKNLNVKDLITKRVSLFQYDQIYNDINSKESIASIIEYEGVGRHSLNTTSLKLKECSYAKSKGILGVIGAGNFTSLTILPCLKSSGANIKFIASAEGMSGTYLAKKYGINYSTTDYNTVLNDNDVDTVIIATRHDSHAKLVIESIVKGKNVYVEKPLALSHQNSIKLFRFLKNMREKIKI